MSNLYYRDTTNIHTVSASASSTATNETSLLKFCGLFNAVGRVVRYGIREKLKEANWLSLTVALAYIEANRKTLQVSKNCSLPNA